MSSYQGSPLSQLQTHLILLHSGAKRCVTHSPGKVSPNPGEQDKVIESKSNSLTGAEDQTFNQKPRGPSGHNQKRLCVKYLTQCFPTHQMLPGCQLNIHQECLAKQTIIYHCMFKESKNLLGSWTDRCTLSYIFTLFLKRNFTVLVISSILLINKILFCLNNLNILIVTSYNTCKGSHSSN